MPHRPTIRRHATALSLAGAALAVTTAQAASAATLTETFNGPGISPLLALSASDPGFSFANNGGWGDFTKADGTGNGFGYLRTKFQLVGDFVVRVDLLRDGLVGQGEAGLDLRFFSTFPNGFADLWSQGLNTLVANAFLPTPPGYGTTTLATNAAVVNLAFVRSGQTLSFFVGGGNVRNVTGLELTGPVTVELFLGQEANQTVGHHALFDNLFIRGEFINAPVPEPASYALFGAGLSLLAGWARRRPVRHVATAAASWPGRRSDASIHGGTRAAHW